MERPPSRQRAVRAPPCSALPSRPSPAMTSSAPPALGPASGCTACTLGGSEEYSAASEVAYCWPLRERATSTSAAPCAGVRHTTSRDAFEEGEALGEAEVDAVNVEGVAEVKAVAELAVAEEEVSAGAEADADVAMVAELARAPCTVGAAPLGESTLADASITRVPKRQAVVRSTYGIGSAATSVTAVRPRTGPPSGEICTSCGER
eukprot:1899050-Prymnesium_polylepis.1